MTMPQILVNWMTSGTGLAALLVAVADILHPGILKDLAPQLQGQQADLGLITLAIIQGIQGLVAKDANK